MGLFSKFERRVEDGFDEMGDKFFDAPISPVQIAKKAEKQMRREKMVGAGKEFAPTLYTVLVNPEDDERLFGYYPTLAGETETYLRGKAQELGLAMDGAPLVRFIIDDELKRGKFDVVAELVSAPIVSRLRAEEMQRYGLEGQAMPQQPAPQQAPRQSMAPAAEQYASSGIDVMADEPAAYADMNMSAAPVAAPVATPQPTVAPQPADINQTRRFDDEFAAQPVGRHVPQQPRLIDLTTNRSFPLTKDRILMGRALSSDIAIEDLNVSRTHAEIRHEAATAWSIADLGSTNGTLVNGRHIASVMLQEGDRVTVGTTTFLFTFQ
ncbi:MAG: DUF3662 and FHA domain-containing protein [Eggerthellaceae bacterium]